MTLDWNLLRKELSPLKDYEDLTRRFREAFACTFVRRVYNLTLPEMCAYTQRLLGGDTRGRYADYAQKLVAGFTLLHQAGVKELRDLVGRVGTRLEFEAFTAASGVPPADLLLVLKYLVYWFIPTNRYLNALFREDPRLEEAVRALREVGIRKSLDLLERGNSPSGRKEIARASRLAEEVILELVHRADLSRLPWSSKATISNLLGAGYGSLAALAGAQAEELYADFFRYGRSIGKNLKLGNEIENSHRIAKILPVVLQDENGAV